MFILKYNIFLQECIFHQYLFKIKWRIYWTAYYQMRMPHKKSNSWLNTISCRRWVALSPIWRLFFAKYVHWYIHLATIAQWKYHNVITILGKDILSASLNVKLGKKVRQWCISPESLWPSIPNDTSEKPLFHALRNVGKWMLTDAFSPDQNNALVASDLSLIHFARNQKSQSGAVSRAIRRSRFSNHHGGMYAN